MSKMNVIKPIVFFDLETTGTDVANDRIVELAVRKIYPGTENRQEIETILINPGVNIPEHCTDIHGITNYMVAHQPLFKHIAKYIFDKYFQDSDVAGFNILRFDVPLLSEEFSRAGIVWPDPDTKYLDSYKIFAEFNPRSLAAAVKQYLGEDIKDAHSAGGDVDSTYRVAMAQLKQHFANIENAFEFCEDSRRVDFAGKLYKDDHGVVRYNVGKHKDEPVKEYESFARWMMSQDWVTRNTINCLKQALGIAPTPPVVVEPEKESTNDLWD